MTDSPCCETGNPSDCGRIGTVNEVGPESVGSALDPALTPESPEAVMDDTEPRPPLTEAQLDELEARASARRTMPVPSYLALAADLHASRAREAALQQRIDKALGELPASGNLTDRIRAALSGDAS